VNTYKNVFFIQHIYKPATSLHSKPRLFGTTTWTLLLPRFVNFSAHDFRTGLQTDSRISCPPKFVPSPARGFRLPRVHDSESSPIQDSRIRMFANLKLRRSRTPENREFPAPEKTYLKNFVKLNVSRVMGFPEFPNSTESLLSHFCSSSSRSNHY
jgi:hypothetical protein